MNRLAVIHGARIFSSYEIAGKRVWIITDADRNSTTLLFQGEHFPDRREQREIISVRLPRDSVRVRQLSGCWRGAERRSERPSHAPGERRLLAELGRPPLGAHDRRRSTHCRR